MKYIDDFKGTSRTGVPASLGVVRTFEVGGIEVLMLDIENVGVASLSSLKLYGRVSPSAPARDLTPTNWTDESAFLWKPPSTSPALLAAGGSVQFGLNVSSLYAVEIWAAGNGAALAIAAGAYKVEP